MKQTLFIFCYLFSLTMNAQVNWYFPNQAFTAGDTVEARCHVAGFQNVGAFQYALLYDTAVLSIITAQPFTFTGNLPYDNGSFSHGLMPGLSPYTNLQANEIRTAWADPTVFNAPDSSHIYSIWFVAKQRGTLCQRLIPYYGLMPWEIYNGPLTVELSQQVTCGALRRRPALQRDNGPALAVQVAPNPVRESSLLWIDMADAGPVQVSIFDAFGRPAFSRTYDHGGGTEQYEISFPQDTGVYWVGVETSGGRVFKKVWKQ